MYRCVHDAVALHTLCLLNFSVSEGKNTQQFSHFPLQRLVVKHAASATSCVCVCVKEKKSFLWL